MQSLIILSSFFLDYLLGDPRWFPHPVRAIGRLIQGGEAVLRRFDRTPKAEKIAGVILVIVLISIVYFIAHFLILLSYRMSTWLGFLVSVLIGYTTLAARDLAGSAKRVLARLDADDLVQAREKLSMIVGRDTDGLDENGISRAVVETVAENASDGVIAPLVYMAIGGPALALAYKAVNTMDSMIGYKNERYVNFGWAAAKLDDVANFIPARVTAALICLASNVFSLFHSPFRTPHSALASPWRIMLRDGGKHPSPNSGWPEAAMAGSLGVRLGGPSTYGGTVSLKPVLGEEGRAPVKKDIEKSVRFMYSASLLAASVAAVGCFCLNF